MTTNEKWLLRAIKGTALALCLLLVISSVFPGLVTYGTKAFAEQEPTQPKEASAISEEAGEILVETEATGSPATEPIDSQVETLSPALSSAPVQRGETSGKGAEEAATEIGAEKPEAETEIGPETEMETEWTGELTIQADTTDNLSTHPGQSMTLPLGIRYTRGEQCWESIQDTQRQRIGYDAAAGVEEWRQPPPEVYSMEIRISQGEEGVPFTQESLAKQRAEKLVEHGDSCGYVNFSDLMIAPDTAAGNYPVSFVVSWWAQGQEEAQKARISLSLRVEDAETEEGLEETGGNTFFCCCMESATWEPEQAEELIIDANTGLQYAVVREDVEAVTGVVMLVEQEDVVVLAGEEAEEASPAQEIEEVASSEEVELEEDTTTAEALYCPCIVESLGCAYCEALYAGEKPEEDISCILPHGESLMSMSLMSMPITYGDGIIVFTIDELRDAITAGNTLIYLGFNDGEDETSTTLYVGRAVNNGSIVATGKGCSVPSGVSVTIVGRDPNSGERVTFTDWASDSPYASFYPVGTGQTITLSDMKIFGNNYYGPAAGCNQAYTTLVLKNVEYVGPQLIHNKGLGSKVVLSNCDITIQKAHCAAQEVAEADDITLQGTVEIKHCIDGTNGNAVFFPNNTLTLTVDSGANVDIKTGSYFLYAGGATMNINGTLTLEINNKTGASNSFFTAAGYFATLNIPSGGQMKYTYNSSAASVVALSADTSTINGTLVVQRNAGTNNTHYALKLKDGATLTIGDGAYVELSNAGGPVLSTYSGTATINLTTRAINRFESVSGVPTQVWNNADASPFNVVMKLATAAGSNSVTSVAGLEGVTLGAAPYAVALANKSPVNMLNDRRVIFGSVGKVTLPSIVGGSTWFDGEAPSGASLVASEVTMQNGKAQSTLQTSAAITCGAGAFSFQDAPFANPLQHIDSRVYVQAQSGTLTYYTYADVIAGTPSIVSLPATMAFETKSLSSKTQTIGRQDPDWAIEVYDPRTATDSYRLCVSIQQPLTGQTTGDTLPGALVYSDGTQTTPLSSAQLPVAVKSGVSGQNSYTHQWASDRGILVELPGFAGLAEETYATELLWTLVVE